ncbi:TRAP transporter substrate-binding protein [Jannaschia sp. LMIT008]|uniref:TRAP transporter substrate-binding protein n=1 Tax=Jannaschia maritima TaxID=3032585 RepID=UPI0028115316|nr:TRAP transporter substrate-binding protein [Jannaschia sp. LMIT008]
MSPIPDWFRRLPILGVGLAVLLTASPPVAAQEVTLRLHQFLPAQANVPELILDVWADRIEDASDDRIAIERYPSMQLGGAPPELMDQAIDGVADIVMTVVGYTPGRFPTTEVFELPFFVTDARAASAAFWSLYEEEMQAEFADVHVLGTWVHGPGLFHSVDPIESLDDLRGVKVRGPSRMVNAMLDVLGAEPVGMPVPAVPEALSKGVIDGAMLPWEVVPSLRVHELVEFHTGFDGPALYTLTFVLVMNREAYASLPDDLRTVVDDNSGLAFSVFAGGTQADADAPARDLAVDLGNEIITIPADRADEWRAAVQPVYDSWIADMDAAGRDGAGILARAQALMDGFDPSADTYGDR